MFDAQGKKLATWAWGDMRYGNTDETNIDYVIGQRDGSLGPYVKTYRVFKCPSDKSSTTFYNGVSYPRVRSYSMNMAMGTAILSDLWPGSVTFLTRSDISSGPRPELCVFLDIHEDYLDTCQYWLGFDTGKESFANLPASRHGGSGVLSFTDGRAEIHRWRDARTFQPVKGTHGFPVQVLGSPDWRYLYLLTSKYSGGTDPTHHR
jgi:hypothetical protein